MSAYLFCWEKLVSGTVTERGDVNQADQVIAFLRDRGVSVQLAAAAHDADKQLKDLVAKDAPASWTFANDTYKVSAK